MKTLKNPDQQYIQQLEKIRFQPIFILGLHRSGTSILYKMLTATGNLNPVTAYHLISYDQLLSNHIHKQEKTAKDKLTNFFKEQGQADRGIDRLTLTADFAEEYGFLLGKKTFQLYLTPKNLSLFIEMAKKIQFISENKKPLLLKNPHDFPNFIYIKQMFPNAKFIFIHRHPFKTLSSLIKALRLLLKSKNPYTNQLLPLYEKVHDNPLLLKLFQLVFSKYSPFGIMLLTLNSVKSVNFYLKNIRHLSKDDYISLTYENLCKKPQENMETILNFLNLPLTTRIDFATFIRPRKTQVDLSVMQMQHFVFKCMRAYFNKFGYSLHNY